MAEPQHYSIQLQLDKEFLRKVHAYPSLRENNIFDEEASKGMWLSTPHVVQVSFGGKFGTQFGSLEEIQSFNHAFDEALNLKGIDPSHKHRLLYFMIFYKEDVEKQSQDNNLYNRLHDYAQFIIDLGTNCEAHFAAMEKNKAYTKIWDEATLEYLFVKNYLLDIMTEVEACEYFPDEDHKEDRVTYTRIKLGNYEMYIPDEIVFNLRSDEVLKSFFGNVITNIDLPNHFQYHLFKYTIDFMVNEHKRNNTTFYKELIEPGLTDFDFKAFSNSYKRHTISDNQSLYRIMLAMSTYLMDVGLCKTKVEVSALLFEYFALFRVLKVKKDVIFPSNYSDLSSFYISKGVNSETVRWFIKDNGRVWGNFV